MTDKASHDWFKIPDPEPAPQNTEETPEGYPETECQSSLTEDGNKTSGWIDEPLKIPEEPPEPDGGQWEDRTASSAGTQGTDEGTILALLSGRLPAPAPAQTARGETAPLTADEPLPADFHAPAPYTPQNAVPTAYRLVRFGPDGIEAVERRGYGSLRIAALAAAERPDECAISCVEIETSDLLSVDGKLVNDAARALEYDARRPPPKPEYQFLYSPRGRDRNVGTLLDETVPGSWLGQAHVGSDGAGIVWTSTGIAEVRDYEYTRDTVPERLFFWSIAVTEAWKKRVPPESRKNHPELLPVSAADAERWRVPAGTTLLLLKPAPKEATDQVRNAIPVQEGAIDALMHVNPFGDASDRESWYRAVKLGTRGWEPLSKCAHSTEKGATEEAIRNDFWDSDVIIVRANGLEPDITIIDGKLASQSPLRTVPDRSEVVVYYNPATAGEAALDDDGNGYVFDGERLVRVENGKVAPGQNAPGKLPSWIYEVLRAANINPSQRNVHGIIVRIGTEIRQKHQLDDEVRAALLSRRTTRRHELYVRTLTLAELRALEGNEAIHLSMGRTGSDEQLPHKLLPGEQDDEDNSGS